MTLKEIFIIGKEEKIMTKQYKLFKTVKKTAKENNLLIIEL